MAKVKHAFVSSISDGGDSSLVRPSNWNADHQITDQFLGRHTIGAGANTYQIVHNLADANAALVGFSTTWPTGVFVTATALNTIDVEFSNGAPVGGGTFISRVEVV